MPGLAPPSLEGLLPRLIACPAWAVLVDLVGVPRLPVASLRRVRPLRRPPIMRIDVDGITVYFPYEFVYPEQYAYMVDLKRTLDARGHSILEMPTGTGKTVTLLSLILSYQLYRPELAKLVYCTRTVGEMDKVLHELRRVLAHRDKCYAEDAPARAAASRKALAVGLTTRRNLCLHPAVSSASSREEADALCRSMTASWARGDPEDIEDVGGRAPRRGAATNGSVVRMADADEEEEGGAPRALTAAAAAEKGLCEYFEGYDKEGTDAILPAGVYGIDELIAVGKERGWCPYYTARHALSFANVIVYNYQYLIDPKVAGLISRDLARECVVVFDEVRLLLSCCWLLLVCYRPCALACMRRQRPRRWTTNQWAPRRCALAPLLFFLVLDCSIRLTFCRYCWVSMPIASLAWSDMPVSARSGSQHRQRVYRRPVCGYSRGHPDAEPAQPGHPERPRRVHQDDQCGPVGGRVRAACAGDVYSGHPACPPG